MRIDAKRLPSSIVMGSILVALGCSARAVEEEDPLDIEAICLDHCERYMECLWYPGQTFSTVEGCVEACGQNPRWAPECASTIVDLYECGSQFECPEFAERWISECEPELLDYSNCVPERW